MSTAHRPTFQAAMGHDIDGSWSQKTAKDKGYVVMKERKRPEVVVGPLKKNTTEKHPRSENPVEDETPSKRVKVEEEVEVDEEKISNLEEEEAEFDDSDEDLQSSGDESEEEDDDEDETEELLRELEKIKRERAEEALRKEEEAHELMEKQRREAVLTGNPLLAHKLKPEGFTVKRRWDDDVVFKDQARKEKDSSKEFVNDPIRNHFHRRFLYKYIK